jgi:energy-coupling factor transporter ATP-binding protein EcfA2
MKQITKKNASSNLSLELEVRNFVNEFPYWTKFLSDKILSGNHITDKIVDQTYEYLLEDLKLKSKTSLRRLNLYLKMNCQGENFKELQFTHLEDVKGVNALSEDQIIKFGPKLTILFGSNGSGKSGYVRLLKKVFYSKAPEEILGNVYSANSTKPVSAKFTFNTNAGTKVIIYPNQISDRVFNQFSVFDEKSVISQLDQRNEFEFRPAGLIFFSELTEALKKLESRLNSDIISKKSTNIFIDQFDGDSEIKTVIEGLSYNTDIETLKKYIPLTTLDQRKKELNERNYNDLFVSSKRKAKEISNLETIKSLLKENEKGIKDLNEYFTKDYINKIEETINDYQKKEIIAKSEGIENLRSNIIKGIGTSEWKAFIEAAEEFAGHQKELDTTYPNLGDFCIFCHQPLSNAAIYIITNYWIYLRSEAEKNLKLAANKLIKFKIELEKIDFDLFRKNHLLTIWMAKEYPTYLKLLKNKIDSQRELSKKLIQSINNKKVTNLVEINIGLEKHTKLIDKVDISIQVLTDSKEDIELVKYHKIKTLYDHREKLQSRINKIEKFINNQKWIYGAKKLNWQSLKLQITSVEKQLSNKYFNQSYIDTFNSECQRLNGEFGIFVEARSSEAKTNRKFLIKGVKPSSILSEGEQKVIAIADFLSEMKLSEFNKGLVFDDPVNSLDEVRKSEIAKRLVQESSFKQTIIFTHDLVFVSSLIGYCTDFDIEYYCHWIENRNGKVGQVWLNNSPSYEKEYRNAEPANKIYSEAKKVDCPPEQREFLIKSGFTALRTCYEVLVINDLFKNVVQRFNERVSIDALKDVYFDTQLIEELQDNFAQCCRYMEGHTHSDTYSYKKPDLNNLTEEIKRYESIRAKIKKAKKPSP